MISYDEAQRIIGETVQPLGRVRRTLDRLLGMVLVQDIKATFDLPRFDNSAVDGYGVKSADLLNAIQPHPSRNDPGWGQWQAEPEGGTDRTHLHRGNRPG